MERLNSMKDSRGAILILLLLLNYAGLNWPGVVADFWGLSTEVQPVPDYSLYFVPNPEIDNYWTKEFEAENFGGSSVRGSASMRQKLELFEGKRRCRYQDTKGLDTIGIGFQLRANRGVTASLIGKTNPTCITEAEITVLYNHSLRRATRELMQALPWAQRLPIGVRDVMIRMSFNMGMGTPGSGHGVLSFNNTLSMLRRGDYQMAASGFRHSAWYKDVGRRRGDAEIAIITRGR